MIRPPPKLLDVLPHRPPSLLLDELLEANEERALARVTIREDSLYFDGVGVPAIVCVEYMAQTIAAFAGAHRYRQGLEAQLGFLLACRRMTLETDRLLLGDELLIEARYLWSAVPLGQFTCRVERRQQTIANSTLSVYEGPLDEALKL